MPRPRKVAAVDPKFEASAPGADKSRTPNSAAAEIPVADWHLAFDVHRDRYLNPERNRPNPIDLWRALACWLVAEDQSEPIPEWIVEYLLEVAAAISQMPEAVAALPAKMRGSAQGALALEALKLNSGLGRGGFFTDRDPQRLLIGRAARAQVRDHGKAAAAYVSVAQQFGIKEAAVRGRATEWERHWEPLEKKAAQRKAKLSKYLAAMNEFARTPEADAPRIIDELVRSGMPLRQAVQITAKSSGLTEARLEDLLVERRRNDAKNGRTSRKLRARDRKP